MKKRCVSKVVYLFIVAIIVIGVAIPTGCFSASAAPSQTGGVIKLRYNTSQSPMIYDQVHGAQPWFKRITEATKGRVVFEKYYNQTLSKGPDAWEATKAGIADISWCALNFQASMIPLLQTGTLPLLPYKSAKQASGIIWKIYEEFPSVANQLKDNKMILIFADQPYFIVNNKRQVKTAEDLKGLKLRVQGGPPTDMMKMLGVAPMTAPMPDSYLNIQKGVIDGMVAQWAIMEGFKIYEVVKYYSYAPLFNNQFALAMNWDTWKRLPPDVQQVFSNLGGLEGSMFWGDNFSRSGPDVRDDIKKKGYNMVEYNIPQEELDKWFELAVKPLWAKWVADRQKEGYSEAHKILGRIQELIKTYNP